jgi:hypothetical protein
MAKDQNSKIETLRKWKARLLKIAAFALVGIGISIVYGIILSILGTESSLVGILMEILTLSVLICVVLAVLIEGIIFFLSDLELKMDGLKKQEKKLTRWIVILLICIGVLAVSESAAFFLNGLNVVIFDDFWSFTNFTGGIITGLMPLIFLMVLSAFLVLASLAIVKTLIFFCLLAAKEWKLAAKNFIALAITVVLSVTLFFLIASALSPGSSRAKARDAKRMSDMRQMVSAQEMYHGETGKFLVSKTMPPAVGTYLDPVPLDPSNSGDHVYRTIDNINDPQKFCYYAYLEEELNLSPGKYYTSSHAGNFKRAAPPKTLDECAEGD